MPAILPSRLKKHALDLATQSDNPAVFVHDLHSLLDRYTDHTHRSGQAGEPFPLIGSYNTPPPVMRQVWVELLHQTRLHPERILPLCDALWAEQNFDMQLLAVRLLGQVSIEPSTSVIERLQTWVRTGMDKRLLDGLLVDGLERLRMHAPTQVLSLVSDWLSSSDLTLQQTGLHALVILSNYPGIENLPSVLKLITPFLRHAPYRLRPDIVALLTVLARTSPSETAYLLRLNLGVPDNPDTPWLIRQVLQEFPEDTRDGLRTAMKEISK